MRGEWRFYTAGEIIFGRGAVRRTGEVVRGLGAARACLITDPGLVAAGLHEPVLASLQGAGVKADLYDGGRPKPTIEAVAASAAALKGRGYEALVALGGGSNIDLAKAIAVLLRHGGEVEDYIGEHRVPGPVLPLVAVSTTAGTGSEVSGASVLADPARKRRGAILSNHLRPATAIYDPLLTRSCPPQVTADAGIDALTHAVEAYLVPDYRVESGPERPGLYTGSSLLTDALAERAIELVGRFLRRAVYKGDDLEAREGMHLASLLAGMAFSNAGLTAVHALEYPVGVATGCTHGAGNGLLLPYVMAYDVPACPERLATVALLLGEAVDGAGRSGPVSAREAALRAVEAVKRLNAEIGIPLSLRELGIVEGDLRPMAEATAQITRLLEANPRPLDADSLEGILREAW